MHAISASDALGVPSHGRPRRVVTLRAVFGLPGEEANRAPFLPLQYARAARLMRTQVLAQSIAALATLWLFRPYTSHVLLLCWLGMVAATLAWGVRCASVFARDDKAPPVRRARLLHAVALVLNALVWAIPSTGFGGAAPYTAHLETWTILAMLMTVAALVVPALPQAALVFSGIVGAAMTARFLSAHDIPMAINAGLFVVIVGGGAVQASRHYLMSRLAEAGMAEHSEVVSMLLREYEEEEADWLWETDANRRVRTVSRRFALALREDVHEIEGTSIIKLIAGAQWQNGPIHSSLHDLAERLKRREAFSSLLVQARVGGENRWWELSGKPKFDAKGVFEGFRGVGSDVTAQRESSDRIAWLARYDTLTGLPNRLMLTETLGETMRHAEQWRSRCAFLMIDLDRFKAVNDTLGHHVGDQLLASVAERLQSLMDANAFCGRLGGDEFAVGIRDASDKGVVDAMARTLIERLSAPYTVDNHTLFVGASVGSAVAPRDGATVETLMRNADLALYRAKDSGGGLHCTYEPVLHAQAEERRLLEAALRRAIERDELALHYQPVVDARDERILAFEALIRWNSPEHGVVSPAKFLPIAEDTRLIVPIGEWVLRTAAEEAAHWPAHVKLAVNVSGEQLLDTHFLDGLVATLATTGLAPQRLEIEVTEASFLRDSNAVRAVLEGAIALGCAVSLDDFGTGHSSLGYLRMLRFSTIKVDSCFVKGGAVGNPESVAIIRAVVAMADSLEMATTAEGVETEDEAALVRRLGCTKVQGYHFSRPMTAGDARALFQSGAADSGRRAR